MNWILAAEGTGGNSNVLLPPTYELVIGTIAFFTIFFLLSKFALPNIKKTLEARTESIEGGIAKAEKNATRGLSNFGAISPTTSRCSQ